MNPKLISLAKILGICLLLAGSLPLAAQTRRVLVTSADSASLAWLKADRPVITVKWYTDEILNEAGVNVYRREKGGEFVKLNSQPIRMQTRIASTDLQRDANLKTYVDALQTRNRKEPLPGVLKLLVLLKSIHSAPFAHFIGIRYDDLSVEAGKEYEYKVMSLKGGSETLLNTSTAITAGSFLPDTAPKGVVITAQDKEKKVNINWQPEEDRYYGINIYRTSALSAQQVLVNASPLIISPVADRQGKKAYPAVFYADTVKQGVTYQYQLAGVDFFGRETLLSETQEIAIKDLIPPPAPDFPAFKVNYATLQVRLSWKPVQSDDVAGYYVYRSLTNQGGYQRINAQALAAGDTTYTDQLKQGGMYYYYLATVDYAGNETAGVNALAEVKDIVPPAKPQGLVLVADTGRFVLKWQKNTESDLKGYLVYRTINKNNRKDFVLLNAQAIKANEYIDQLPKNAKNHFLYKVVAIDSSFNRSEFSDVAIARLPDVTAPQAPFIKALSVKDKALVIEWLPRVDSDLMGYRLYRSDPDDSTRFSTVTPQLLPATATNYTDQQAQPNVNYRYYLQAVDSSGNVSLRSNQYTGRFAPDLVLAARPENPKAVYSKHKKAVTISWNIKKEEQLKGFVLYRRTEAEPFVPLTGLLPETSYVDKDLQPGKTYSYEIRAYHQSGSVAKSSIIQTAITE
jgi:uncharacterized protein